MKHKLYFLFLFTFSIIFGSCKKSCNEEDGKRPALTADALKWLEVSNNNPKFKITHNGQIDTVQGSYNPPTILKQSKIMDDCYSLNWEVRRNNLSLPFNSSEYGAYIELDNYLKTGYRLKVDIAEPYVTESTILDTAFVNGKLYSNVAKTSLFESKFYYAKGIGFIYTKLGGAIIELIP